MNARDPEIDSLLEPLQKMRPSRTQLHRWQQVLSAESSPLAVYSRISRLKRFWPLAAALLIGIGIGFLLGQESRFSASLMTERSDNRTEDMLDIHYTCN